MRCKKKSWRGSKGRRQTSMTRGYRSWLQDLINVWTMPATMLKNKVMYREFIQSVAFVNSKCCTCLRPLYLYFRTRLVHEVGSVGETLAKPTRHSNSSSCIHPYSSLLLSDQSATVHHSALYHSCPHLHSLCKISFNIILPLCLRAISFKRWRFWLVFGGYLVRMPVVTILRFFSFPQANAVSLRQNRQPSLPYQFQFITAIQLFNVMYSALHKTLKIPPKTLFPSGFTDYSVIYRALILYDNVVCHSSPICACRMSELRAALVL